MLCFPHVWTRRFESLRISVCNLSLFSAFLFMIDLRIEEDSLQNLMKINRFMAWVLFAAILLYLISGYGMSKGLIDPNLAGKLHLGALVYVLVTSFVFHTSFAIHLALRRWQLWQSPWIKGLYFSFFVILFVGFVIVDRYNPKKQTAVKIGAESTVTTANSTPPSNNSSANQDSNIQSARKTFTLTELARYNGRDGQPAYVAVDGVVYDMTSIFIGGYHHGYSAGADLSAAFHAQHYDSYLSSLTIAGYLN